MSIKRKRILDFATYAALCVILFFTSLPFLSMLGTALKTKAESMSNLALFPSRFSFESFVYVIKNTNYLRYMLNSFVVAVCTTIICAIIASMAGYAISRFHSPFFSGYAIMMLILQMFPAMVLLIPLFGIFNRLGLIDNLLSTVISYSALNIPFSIWMLKGFFDTIPLEVEESAMIDGCSQFSSFYRIILALSGPGISTVAIFTFVNAWNDFLLASIFLRSDNVKTLTVGLQVFVQQFTTDWTYMMAAASIASVPTLVFLLFAQKYLIQGLMSGSMKG